MTCVSACSKKYWRDVANECTDDDLLGRLRWAFPYWQKAREEYAPADNNAYHDWVGVMAILVREARKRGLSPGIPGLRT